MSLSVNAGGGSSIKESLASWGDLAGLLRGGDQGAIVPVVIPRDNRGLRWTVLVWFGLFALCSALMMALNASAGGFVLGVAYVVLAVPTLIVGVLSIVVAGLWWWRSSIIEIEEGTHGILTKYGAIVKPIGPGRHYLWHPWSRVDFVVDTRTEIPYTAPVLACPTRENVPLKSIEFFLKFQITDPIRFVTIIGASNFDLVLSSAVQDAIRQRSRLVNTESAYDLRGSNVEDMRRLLNGQLEKYGVRITGCNIPDVQLPSQYQQHLSTRERVAKELVAYEQEWELTRKRRIDTLLMDIERSKKTRDAKIVEVNASLNKARKDVAQMLEEQETEAQRVRYEIETRGRADLVAAENEAKAQERLATAYRDNRAVLEYELARRRLDVGATLAGRAPRPVVVQTEAGAGDGSALSTLLTAQLLPQVMDGRGARTPLGGSGGSGGAREVLDSAQGAVAAAAERQQQLADEYQRQQGAAMREQFERGEGYGGQGRR
ncbi:MULTISPECIES: SPFH domain-containing protein [Nocardiopsis]|uniref:Band 7 protein n=1 Tax=Nocardiopsis dassonvillei (strain ATCC 23218 / DSM 43111 / CIP 107115 / JCM 7437 / KCTC 9190 / NBRC 14626 / NCTC 10488 / NRRL B-5397 / IMRU 509) TaxID=446468 RepID=D7B339_NOCDD|nr:SPFH domain-containing protein [Nocardiopsis dassonvillei]ADH68729.1 band 7 protein [Nocardiopsis dassonvillei subsp. dassonvillei DSM 43111]APC36789.1 peptidase [Nocardiopsis dassonvillei]NKY78043.1 SPFH domain-containing protein [Nocardiopsis dassonvillei]VEI89238.1 SPFH domain / Band 7 family [Nocardiopsis dassonvillei]